jgi:biopolymer transport protein ExbB
MLREHDSRPRTLLRVAGLAVLLLAGYLVIRPYAWAQQPGEEAAGPSAVQPPPAGAEPAAADPPPVAPAEFVTPPTGLFDINNAFALWVAGGWWMVPITFMSLIMVTVTIERGLALRRKRLIPEELVTQLSQLSGSQGGFDPRQAYRLCQQFPCAASAVIRAMLVKVGRPHSEVEHAVTETAEREAERAFANVRWLNLCTGVTPLMGLIGTVWGMIIAFHQTTVLTPGQDRATQLAQGIYIALVTTLGGLMVAIPASILAHFFEMRIVALFHEIDEMLFNLMPLVERYEGRVRFGARPAGEQAGENELPPEPPAAGK